MTVSHWTFKSWNSGDLNKVASQICGPGQRIPVRAGVESTVIPRDTRGSGFPVWSGRICRIRPSSRGQRVSITKKKISGVSADSVIVRGMSTCQDRAITPTAPE